MKLTFIFLIGTLFFFATASAQKQVIDAVDHTPIPAASIFDASGNMVGYTLSDGVFSEIPESAYPITVHCIGYERLVIEHAEDKVWEMKPSVYDLNEVVVTPAKCDVMKQIFYIREFFSMSNETDTVTVFSEHMADWFVPNSKDAKFGGDLSLRILESRQYSHYQLFGKDSISTDPETNFPSMVEIFKPIGNKVTAPASFKEPGDAIKLHEESGKSGMFRIKKQNDQTFTIIADGLADSKEHKMSPWLLKFLGFTMDFNQFYVTQVYRVNDKGVYMLNDLIEASFVMQADGRGKFLRMALNSDKPIVIRSMVEYYVVDRDYLSKEEAKEEYKNKPTNVKFVIPSTVPPLNEATKRLVERANAEAKK
jgi:hypothetical protein